MRSISFRPIHYVLIILQQHREQAWGLQRQFLHQRHNAGAKGKEKQRFTLIF